MRASVENGGVFTSPCSHTGGLSARLIRKYMSELTYCQRVFNLHGVELYGIIENASR